MNDLVARLAQGRQPLVFARSGQLGGARELKAAIDRKYVQLKFTATRGGTELGFDLDLAACDFARADFEAARGSAHLEGELTLDYVPVRLVADIDLGSL